MAIIIDVPAKQSTLGAVRALGGLKGGAQRNWPNFNEVDEQADHEDDAPGH
jgi:hypothetical protein